MKKVAVFGNAGAGKSTLARRLAEITGLPLYPIDMIQFPDGYRPDAKDGGSFTATTVIVNVTGADVFVPLPLSESVAVIVAEPFASGTGV